MSKTIRCPACGHVGDSSDDIHFEVRGQYQGKPVRRCLRCGTGLMIRMLGKPQVIPHVTWVKMQEMWESEFGSSATSTSNAFGEAVLEAAKDFRDELPENLPGITWILFAAAADAASHCVVVVCDGGSLAGDNPVVAAEDRALDVLTVGTAHNVLLFFQDNENLATFSEALDCKPSQVVPTVWESFLDVLSDGQAERVEHLQESFGGEAAQYFVRLNRAAREAAAMPDTNPDVLDATRWAAVFKENFQSFDQNFWHNINDED